IATTDGGLTWTSQTNPSRAHLFSVSFTDKNTGLAVGDRGVVLRTTDGGKVWKEVVRLGVLPLTSVTFINHTRAITVGYGGRVLKTADAGATWEPLDVGMTNDLLSVYFADE